MKTNRSLIIISFCLVAAFFLFLFSKSISASKKEQASLWVSKTNLNQNDDLRKGGQTEKSAYGEARNVTIISQSGQNKETTIIRIPNKEDNALSSKEWNNFSKTVVDSNTGQQVVMSPEKIMILTDKSGNVLWTKNMASRLGKDHVSSMGFFGSNIEIYPSGWQGRKTIFVNKETGNVVGDIVE